MPWEPPSEALAPVPGVAVGTACAGIKRRDRDDIALFCIEPGAETAAVFTRNAFCAAPVLVAREHLQLAQPRFLLVNAGNANAGTGAGGTAAARASCEAVAALGGCPPQAVLPFSTGVIGVPLPVDRIRGALPEALAAAHPEGWSRAARAIMTTDTRPKSCCRRIRVGDQDITVTGIAKGAGMIRPDMATMLAFVATDARLRGTALVRCLGDVVEESFNRITVDGDTSTNDACVLVATGRTGPPISEPSGPGFEALREAVREVCQSLAQAIVRDGEGATKFITVEVSGGRDREECLAVAYAIAHSPLVKTAFFASDANWGRILAAVGRAGIQGLDINRVRIHLGGVCIVDGGGRAPGYTEAAGAEVMAAPEIAVTVDLGRGAARERVWTCDFSYDYVRINAEYRT